MLCVLAACVISAHAHLLDARLGDFLFMLRGPRPVQAPLAIVTVQPRQGGQARPWGCTTEQLAEVIRTVARARPKAIVVAITALRLMREDEPGIGELAAAVRQAGNVVLAGALVPASEADRAPEEAWRFACGNGQLLRPAALRNPELSTPPAPLVAAAAGVGTANLYPDVDGVVRSFPLMVSVDGTLFPSLPLEAVRVAMGLAPGSARLEDGHIILGDTAIPVTAESAEMTLDFPGGRYAQVATTAEELATVSDAELHHQLGDKVVVVAAGVTGLTTLFPTSAGTPARGAEVVAAAIENIMARRWVRTVCAPGAWAVALVAALIAMVLAWKLSPLAAAAAELLLIVLLVIGLGAALSSGWLLPGLCILLATGLSSVVNLAGRASSAVAERVAAEARTESRLQALERIGELLGSALNRDELLHAIMRWVTSELQAEAASLLLLDESEKVLRFQVALGPKGPEVQDFVVPLGHGIAGYVAETGQPLIVSEGWRHPRHARDISAAIDFHPRNILCVPMRLHGKVIGVIEVMNKLEGEDFDSQDEYLLTTIAQQAALLLENARLYAELQERVDFANAELREAYRQLESEKAKVETLIDQMASPVVATDADNTVVLLNNAAEQALGVQASDALGKPVFAVIPVPQVVALFAADLEANGDRLVEEIELGDGRVSVYRASIALVRDASGNAMGKSLVMIDITELRELDRMKTDLISFVAHELRNPLSIIGGFAQLCLRRLQQKRTDAAEEILKRIEAAARRTERLVEDFLNISRLEAGRPLDFHFQPVTDVEVMVRETIELEPRKKPTHTFVVDIPPDLPPLYADRGKLEEILTNIIGNAVKYSPRGGEIRITARREGAMVHFAVSDQGVGIPPEDLPHIFEKFRRVRKDDRKAIPGTGVGLYLCKQLVEGHGGQIWVESEPGKGTTVHFTIPVAVIGDDAQADEHAESEAE